MAMFKSENMSISRERKDDKRLAFVITYMVLGIFLNNLANIYATAFNAPLGFVSPLNKAVIFALFVLNIWSFLKRITVKSLLFYFSLFLVLGLNYILNDPASGFTKLVSSFITTVFPMIVVMFYITDYDELLVQLTSVSKIIVLLSTTVLLVLGKDLANYYMGFSNALVPPILFLINDFFTRRKKSALVLGIIGIGVIIAIGSRGSLVGIFVFFMIQLFYGVVSPKTFVRSAVAIMGIVLIYLNFNTLLLFANSLFASLGITSRTIGLLLQDEVSTSGRDVLYQIMWRAFSEEPLAIHGIGSEYKLINMYPHNLILELLYQFGLLFGGAALLCIGYFTIRTVFNNNKTAYKKVRLIFFSASVPLLMVSASFWFMPYFWMWIVMCLHPNRDRVRLPEQNRLIG